MSQQFSATELSSFGTPLKDTRRFMWQLDTWKEFCIAGANRGIACQLSDSDLSKLVDKTCGYSGSDMRNLIQEACQGPVRDAIKRAGQEEEVANLSEADLRPVNIKDFQVRLVWHQVKEPMPSSTSDQDRVFCKTGCRSLAVTCCECC